MARGYLCPKKLTDAITNKPSLPYDEQRLITLVFGGTMSYPGYSLQQQPRVFDTSFDYKTDTPSRTGPDPDKDSQRLRLDHELLWTKRLRSGVVFPRAFHRLDRTST